MVSRRTRIVALLLLLAIHAVGVVSAFNFRSPDRGEWPQGQVLTDYGYVTPSTQIDRKHHLMLAIAEGRYRTDLKERNIRIVSMKNGVKLHENEYDEALEIANRGESTYIGKADQDHYIASIIRPSSELGRRLGLRPWRRIPFFSPKRHTRVLWKYTDGGKLSIVGVTKLKTKDLVPGNTEGLQEVLRQLPK